MSPTTRHPTIPAAGTVTRALLEVRSCLEAYVGEVDAVARGVAEGMSSEATESSDDSLQVVVEALGLSPFERDVLLLCAGVELDPAFRDLCARGHGDPLLQHASFGLALAALPGAHWSAVAPTAPLRRWQLVQPDGGESAVRAPLRIDERVLHYLLGVRHLDARLLGLAEPVALPGPLPPSQARVVERMIRSWEASTPGERPVLQLVGADAGTRADVAAAGAARVGLTLHRMRAADLPTDPARRYALARLWERESVLAGSAILLEAEPEHAGAATALAGDLSGLVLVSSPTVPAPSRRPAQLVHVAPITTRERRALWRTVLGQRAAGVNGEMEAVVSQFMLGSHAIRSTGAEALRWLAADGEAPGGTPVDDGSRHVLWDACRIRSRAGLDGLAQRVEPAAGWDDLMLPETQRATLRSLAAQLRQRTRVHEEWGFAARMSRGLGISAVFAGPSGTGKTMAAEVLAGELRLDLYRIDLSQVVSKYIGETEKNLDRIFSAAEAGGAILLFDEADALFGKRSEVRDSHDRYANIEVSYLLQRMEAYRGLAILTTNQRSALDPSFLRRVRFVVEFPFPDAATRADIWRRVFPSETPTEGLDPARLARLTVAGGNIHNIALNGAFLAADEGSPVRMSHLLRAARAEYAKLERTLSGSETAGWT